jgi:multiple sugar transport system permease protein
MGIQRRFTPWLAGIAALIALAILLFPVYAVVVGSFENNAQLLGTHYNFLPPTPTLANYRTVLSQQGGHIISSLIIGLATALLTLAIALPAAHALARYRFRATVGVVASLLVAQILPSIVIANSLFVVYHKLHLLNSYPGLILADASYAVPFSILVMRAFMLGLPTDVLQAARVDGATEWGTLLNGSTVEPITLSIYNYIGVYSENLGAAMALAVFAILPAAMMLIAAQRYIAAGLTVGSVKG